MSAFPKEPLAGARPADLAWLTGSWHGRVDGGSVEEHWSALGGGSLMGMFRWVRGDQVRFYEIEAIEQEGPHVVLRVKHFDRGLIGWEEKGAPHDFVLVEVDERGAVFRERDKPDPRWAVYRRRGPDAIDAYFTRGSEPEPDPGVFRLARRRS